MHREKKLKLKSEDHDLSKGLDDLENKHPDSADLLFSCDHDATSSTDATLKSSSLDIVTDSSKKLKRPGAGAMVKRPLNTNADHEKVTISLNTCHDSASIKTLSPSPLSRTKEISEHYNAIPDRGLLVREQSSILNVRQFNNWIKSVLINKASDIAEKNFNVGPNVNATTAARNRRVLDALDGEPNEEHVNELNTDQIREKNAKDYINNLNEIPIDALNVLDLGCGKGGDILKWANMNISLYVGLDNAFSSIGDAKVRAQKLRHSTKKFIFGTFDCYHQSITPKTFKDLAQESKADDWERSELLKVDRPEFFHVISCMFSLHYAFENFSSAMITLKNISNNLSPGGIFIATIPNESYIQERLQQQMKSSPNEDGFRKFGNSLYNIRISTSGGKEDLVGERNQDLSDKEKLEQELADNLDKSSSLEKNFKTSLYYFTLKEAVDNCPEYTVPFDLLVQLAQSVGMSLLFYEPFHLFYDKYKKIPKYAHLLKKFKIVDQEKNLLFTQEEWETVGIYTAVGFVKNKP